MEDRVSSVKRIFLVIARSLSCSHLRKRRFSSWRCLVSLVLIPLSLDRDGKPTPGPITIPISCLVQHMMPPLWKVVPGQEACHHMLDGHIVFEHWLCPAYFLQHLSSTKTLNKRVWAADDSWWLCVLDVNGHLAGSCLVGDWAAGCECQAVLSQNHLPLQLFGPCWLCCYIPEPVHVSLGLREHYIDRG